MSDPPAVIVLTGLMAAGKSTVAQLLAERLPRAAHIRGDVFRRMIVTGRADPTPEGSAEQTAQLHLRYRLSATIADAYAAAGFTAVVQDIILGPDLADYLALLTARPRHLIVLAPRPEVVEARDRDRTKTGYTAGWTPAAFDAWLRSATPRTGLWLDNSDQTPTETATHILTHLPASRLD